LEIAKATIETEFPETEIEVLDLSRTTSEFRKTIHPCKSCVSTSKALR
jgi:hypothetical protein